MVVANDRIVASRAVRGVVSLKSILDGIHQIQLPTLVITADQDRVTSPAPARDLHERVDGSSLVTIEGSGRMTPAEKPGEVNRALEGFYARPGADRLTARRIRSQERSGSGCPAIAPVSRCALFTALVMHASRLVFGASVSDGARETVIMGNHPSVPNHVRFQRLRSELRRSGSS